jgi:asparagine synthase (glutamine-hydrolysing)
MCGIAGYINLTSPVQISREILQQMARIIRHRGPDAQDIYAEPDAGLAHARLSIIDLEGGRQPMSNEDGSLWITFNGEIFNYLELREILLKRGHRFRTQSDTEVILHLFEDDGEDCVHRLNGQWAFAIWDRKRKRLFLSRDRFGVRPLFYTESKGQFLFASEIKALFAHPNVGRELDVGALNEIFTYWVTLPPRTFFKNIYELPPGHSLTVDQGHRRISRYWQLDFSNIEATGVNITAQEQRYTEELSDLLIDATRIRLRADVPVGAYLSGGLDSTVTTALIRRYGPSKLETFSVAFDDPEFDESAYQNEAVRYLATDHHELRCSAADIVSALPAVLWHTEKPILRTAPVPLFLLSRTVRERGYKVVLTGEGADELLGGYDIFKEAKIRRFWAAHPDSRVRPILLRRLYPYLTNLQAQSDAYRKAFFHIDKTVNDQFFSHHPRWELTSKLKLFFSDHVRASVNTADGHGPIARDLPRGFSSWHWFAQAQYLESAFLLPGYILSSQGDRVAMAHGIEGRFPFLDYRVAEFASRVPPNLKMKVLNEKNLLKRSAKGLIPDSIARRKKQPYRAPEARSLLQVRNHWVEELLSPERLRRDGLFHPGAVRKLTAKVKEGRALGIKDNMALVGILSTQLVIDQFINSFRRYE